MLLNRARNAMLCPAKNSRASWNQTEFKKQKTRRTKMKQYVQIFTTTGRREDAEKVARTLVQKRLAGCVQIIGPIQSTYWWKNRKETAEEWLCLIKSEKACTRSLRKPSRRHTLTKRLKSPLYPSLPEAKNTSNGFVTNLRDNLARSSYHSQQQPLGKKSSRATGRLNELRTKLILEPYLLTNVRL